MSFSQEVIQNSAFDWWLNCQSHLGSRWETSQSPSSTSCRPSTSTFLSLRTVNTFVDIVWIVLFRNDLCLGKLLEVPNSIIENSIKIMAAVKEMGLITQNTLALQPTVVLFTSLLFNCKPEVTLENVVILSGKRERIIKSLYVFCEIAVIQSL